MPQKKRIRKDILEILKNHGNRSFRPKELAKRLDFSSTEAYRVFCEVLEDLRSAGAVATEKGGRIAYRPTDVQLTGVLSVHPDGYGFVRVEGEDQDYFVRARRMNTAIDGDTVEIARAAPARDDRRKSAEILRIVERKRDSAVGTLHHSGAYAIVIPDDMRLNHDIYVAQDALLSAADGDKVVVSIDAFEDRRGALHGRILKVLGPATDARVQTLAVAMSQGIFVDFPQQVLDEAEGIADTISQSEIDRRLDLRNEMIFTIDPVDARDFDDALHLIQKPDGTIELGVHIADVSHFVREGSEIDREALRRGTSIYLVDRAIPMLPERLSSNICSLRPHEDRLAFSCIIQLTAAGDVLSHRFEETVICSRHRLTYEEAQHMLDGHDSDHELLSTLQAVRALTRKLNEERRRGGSINFGLTEVQIELDDTGHPIAIRPKEPLESHKLIEECMLLANRLVAGSLFESDVDPVVSRIHEHPDRERITNLSQYVRAFGYELHHAEGLVQPGDLNQLLEAVRGQPEAPVIEQAALRAMAKARYGIESIGHYGLSFRHYTHFTSPIRRYPDLIVHRLTRRMLAGQKGIPAAALKKMCDHSSERERVATDAERASVQLKKVIYAADHVGDEFDGVVTSVSRFGVYLELTELLVEGMVHVRDMTDDYYEYDERSFSLVGLRSGIRYRPGDRVRATLAAARVESREIDLVFARGEGKAAQKPRRSSKRADSGSKNRSKKRRKR